MDHRKIERAKIFVKWHVYQVVVYIEKEGVFIVLRRLDIGDPEETV